MQAFGYVMGAKLAHRSETNRAYMERTWRQKLAVLQARAGDDALVATLDEIFRSGLETFDRCTAPKLCYYDCNPSNLLARRVDGAWRLSGLFDFEDSVAGDPLSDLGKCVHRTRIGTEARWRGLLEGYGPIAQPGWERAVELYRLYQAIEYWAWIEFLERPKAERDHILDGIRAIAAEL